MTIDDLRMTNSRLLRCAQVFSTNAKRHSSFIMRAERAFIAPGERRNHRRR